MSGDDYAEAVDIMARRLLGRGATEAIAGLLALSPFSPEITEEIRRRMQDEFGLMPSQEQADKAREYLIREGKR